MELKAYLGSTGVCLSTSVVADLSLIFLPDIAKAIADQYKFVTTPKTVEDFQSTEGIKFEYGAYNGIIVNEFLLFNDGLYCKANVHTDKIVEFGDDVIRFLKDQFKLSFDEIETRWLFNSVVEVELRQGFDGLVSPLAAIAAKVRDLISAKEIHTSNYQFSGFAMGGEGSGEIKPGRFTLERRAGSAIAANLFFSEAPLSTSEHLQIISEIEALF